MRTRQLGSLEVSSIGFGCMNLSHAYGHPAGRATATRVLHKALDLGITFPRYGGTLWFRRERDADRDGARRRRDEFVLASKCGIFRNDEGKREIDGRPAAIRRTCEASLQRLRTDVIDLYYLHRWDKKVPIEDSVGALVELVEAGKIRAIGLSEVSAATLKRAHAVYPITAVQTEYSLWTRNPEIAVLDACRELGVGFVAFSPLARGFLTGALRDADTLDAKDLRRSMPAVPGAAFHLESPAAGWVRRARGRSRLHDAATRARLADGAERDDRADPRNHERATPRGGRRGDGDHALGRCSQAAERLDQSVSSVAPATMLRPRPRSIPKSTERIAGHTRKIARSIDLG